MNKYEKKLGEIISTHSLDIELIKKGGDSNEVFNIHSVKIKLDKLDMYGSYLRYSEDEKGCDALSCIIELFGLLDIHISNFNSMPFYQYAIYVNQGTYDEKYNNFMKCMELKDDLGEYLRGIYL